MRVIHLWLGTSIVAGFGLLFLWGVATWAFRRGPGRGFWWLLTYVQVSLLVQLVAGLQQWLHYVYGIVFPALVLGVAHVLAREMFADRPWAAFALAGFFSLGLTLRALMTGLGVG